MKDLMFDEVVVIGDDYKSGDWKRYAVHDAYNIKGFFGDYRWLSNFFDAPVYFEGLLYPASENAYQAAKIEMDYRHRLIQCSAKDSKKIWSKLPRLDSSPSDWNARKYDVMSNILFDKFYRNKDLRQQLLDTSSKYLEETNHWKDSDWGVDINLGGKNMLGKILMKLRDYWK